MLKTNRYESVSNPSSPSQVILDRRQNLESVLQPTVPIVPDVVQVNTVQKLHCALDNNEDHDQNLRRPRLRTLPKIDYKLMHEYGKQQ